MALWAMIQYDGLIALVWITTSRSSKELAGLTTGFWSDDGNGNSFEVEIYPLVRKWYQNYRRFCGKGVIQYTPRTGSATNWISGEGVTIEKHEDTTPEQDATIAAKAKSLDGRSITYCLVVQDCRAIEDCVLWGTVSERIKDQLELLWDVIMEQVNPPR